MAKKRRTAKGGRKKKKRGAARHRGHRVRALVIIMVIVVASLFAYQRLHHREYPGPERPRHHKAARKDVKVFIADGEGLRPLGRSIKKGPLKAEIREIFKILLWADSGGVLPEGTTLLGVKISGDTAYLDISREIRDNHPGGTSAEMQTIYAIVNTITLNFPRIQRVKILIEGRTMKTLAGHIDISAPLGPYRGLITSS